MANTSEEENTKVCEPCQFHGDRNAEILQGQNCDENQSKICDDAHGGFKAIVGHHDESEIMTSHQKATPTLNFLDIKSATKTLSASNTIEGTGNIAMATPKFNFLDIKSATKRDIEIAGTTDVTGCVFLSNGELIICEKGSKNVKHFTPEFHLKSTFNTEYDIWDVAAVSTEEVVVTDPDNKQIQFLNISDTVTKGKTIHVGMACWGIDYKSDRLYVSGHDGTWKIKVLTMNGDTLNTFTVTQGQPHYISINKDGDKLIACDNSSSVWCTDANGTTLYTYSDIELRWSRGVLFDSYDNFMVCGTGSHNLHVVKKDGFKHKILLTSDDGLASPNCLAYRESDKTLVVGQSSGRSSLLVFKLK